MTLDIAHWKTQIKVKKITSGLPFCPCLLYTSHLSDTSCYISWPFDPPHLPPHPALLPGSFAEALSQTGGDLWWMWLDRSQEFWWVSSNLSKEGWWKNVWRRKKNESEGITNMMQYMEEETSETSCAPRRLMWSWKPYFHTLYCSVLSLCIHIYTVMFSSPDSDLPGIILPQWTEWSDLKLC